MTDFNTSKNNKNIEYAETIALKAVYFILADDKIKEDFITISGIQPSSFEGLVKNPEFFGGILDFLLTNEEKLLEFCKECEIAPEEPARVRQLFPGATYDY